MLQNARARGRRLKSHRSLIFGVPYYQRAVYHEFAEAMPRILYALPHAPPEAGLLTSIDLGRGGQYLPEGVRDRVVEPRQDQTIHVEALYVPVEMSMPPQGVLQVVHPDCSWVRGIPFGAFAARLRATAEPPPAGRRVLVVRRETERRRIGQHGALMAALQRAAAGGGPLAGAEVLEFVGEKLTIPESVQMFHSSDLVIAAHGAGLVFALAMRPGAAMLEITLRDTRRNSQLTYDFFRMLGLGVGLRYGCVLAESRAYRGHDHPINISVPSVVAAAEALMAP